MTKKLFVGGLSWDTSDSTLHAEFSKFGAIVDAKVITDRDTGRSRGFGFVTYENGQDAESAMQQMDGGYLDGRTIRVNEANERPARGGFSRERW